MIGKHNYYSTFKTKLIRLQKKYIITAIRHSFNKIKTVFVNNINRKRPRGRPKLWWLNVVERNLVELRPNWHWDLQHGRTEEVEKEEVEEIGFKSIGPNGE